MNDLIGRWVKVLWTGGACVYSGEYQLSGVQYHKVIGVDPIFAQLVTLDDSMEPTGEYFYIPLVVIARIDVVKQVTTEKGVFTAPF